MSDKPVDLNKIREAKRKEVAEETQSPSMKPKFDVDDFFAGVIEQNRKAKEKAEADRAKRNKITKRRYSIKEGK